MLVTLASTCGLLEPAYSGVELASRKRRLQTLREWDPLARTVAEGIERLDDTVISAMRRD
jgi:hypothetical protein